MEENEEIVGIEEPPTIEKKTKRKKQIDLSALDELLMREGLGQNARNKAKAIVLEAFEGCC